MSSMVLQFSGVSQSQFNAIAAEISKLSGISLADSYGVVEKNGYKLAWTFDVLSGLLSVTILATPFLVPEHLVAEKIRALVNQTLTPTPAT